VTVRDGGMLRARLLAALLRVRREPNFHRNNDRKLGEGMQGCGRCELFGFFASSGRVSGRGGISGVVRGGGGEKLKPESFTHRPSFLRTRRVRHPREFQL
jgi:hypothetical protein